MSPAIRLQKASQGLRIASGQQMDPLDDTVHIDKAPLKIAAVAADQRASVFGTEDRGVTGTHHVG